jgi:hypothetical protein
MSQMVRKLTRSGNSSHFSIRLLSNYRRIRVFDVKRSAGILGNQRLSDMKNENAEKSTDVSRIYVSLN